MLLQMSILFCIRACVVSNNEIFQLCRILAQLKQANFYRQIYSLLKWCEIWLYLAKKWPLFAFKISSNIFISR